MSRATSTPYHDDVYLRFIENHGAGVEALTDAGDNTDLDCPIFNFPGVSISGKHLNERKTI